jgi:3-oxoadipate CoA-transferase beta subunit
MADTGTWQPLGRDQLAMRVAQDIPEGWSVNLGIGIPTLVGNYVPAEREVVFHSENGILGMGPAPPPDQINPWLVNASRQHVTLRSGGSFMSHSDSFALVRGGHLDLCVLGAFQVAENGDLANWARSEDESAPAIGGAMDLAVGARRIWIVMEHNTRSGEARLLRHCTYPLTAKACVLRVYTELAVIDVTPRGFAVADMVPGLSLDELQARTDAPLHRAS